ncbi:MAG TPA: glycosyltransferase family 2 protein [Flavisolibacter sp.]|jgi:cellulose synthase/poly-beta-1,6-N-acetylglucosamine synthase-like glycosyltransferase|nr:glycosyltransferase family 2 protein [Flavisolibacter sp.]
MKEAGYVLYAIYSLLMIWLLANAVIQLHLWRLSRKKQDKKRKEISGSFPFVSIQVPVYNEKYVVEGLLDCLADLAYPKDRMEIFVLDDSTDETVYLVDRKVAELQSKGITIKTVRRTDRKGYKAGALQENLPSCRGELITIFDADFRPPASYLTDLIPHFTDAEIGLVQARWGHLNQSQNFLTRIQSYLLDTYFSIEQAGRYNGGHYSNFCGTAGIWRKECIEDAGGWDGAVLSEDLDLSYRAQLKGWKIAYVHDVVVPAELPATMDAFKVQQARWTKGIMQVCRKNGKQVALAPEPFTKKLHSFFHLTSSFIFPCLLISSLLTIPLLLFRHYDSSFITLTNYASIGGINLLLLTLIFYQGRKGSSDRQFWRYYPVFMVVYMALSVQNTIAVVQGIFGKSSAFIRTPKYAFHNAATTSYFLKKENRTLLAELVLFFYFLSGICISIYLQDYFYMMLFLFMLAGLGILLYQSFTIRRWRWRFALPKVSWR